MKHRHLKSGPVITALTTAVLLGAYGASSANAGRDDYVVAESRFGNGRVVGPVRSTSVGRQVRTPGGSWIHCERSCSETLRVNSVDFWQNEQGAGSPNAIDQQDGLLSRWLNWRGRY